MNSFLNKIAMFVRSALISVPRRVATSLRCTTGRQREWEGRLPNPRSGGFFFVECLIRLWAATDRRYAGHLGWEGPKVSTYGTFQKQTTMLMQTTELKERPLRTTQVFLAWSEPSHILYG